MPREIKTYDERLNQLLDTALQLFFQQGYATTSVQNIIDAVNVAKGTFYHYFKSKEELLEKLIDRETERIMTPIKEIIEKKDLNALDKLNLMFKTAGLKKAQNKDIFIFFAKTLHHDNNLKFRHKLEQKTNALLLPEYQKIIAQGIEEKIFDTLSAYEAAELIIALSSGLNQKVLALFVEIENNPQNISLLESKLHNEFIVVIPQPASCLV